MNKNTYQAILGLCFALLLGAVVVTNITTGDKTFSEEENRILQERPAFSLSSYIEGRFETAVETWADDQFPLRNTLIKVKTSADVTAGKLESNGVYRIKDDYLVEEIQVPDEDNMADTLAAMKKFKKKYKRLPMYFLLAPNAANILSDHLPLTVTMADQNQYMDQFFSDIEEMGYTPVDVRKTFNKHKADTQLYYRTDHHWTTDGAYLAYKKAVDVMELPDQVSYTPYVVKNDFRGTLASKSGFVNGQNDPLTIYLPDEDKDYRNSVIRYTDTQTTTTEFYQLDNLDTKDAYTVFGGSNHPIYTISTPTSSEEKLLLVKDSYANSFIPFLAQNYREVVVVDPRYFFDNIDEIIKSEGITQVLFLYNANTFFADHSLQLILE